MKIYEAKKEELGLVTYTFVRTLEDYDAYGPISYYVDDKSINYLSKNSLRVQLFFDLIINNIKKILVNNICYSIKIKNRPRRINELIARYVYNDRKLDFTTNGNFIGIVDNTKPTSFESISIHCTEDYEYVYVTISNKKPSVVNRFQKLLLNKFAMRVNNE